MVRNINGPGRDEGLYLVEATNSCQDNAIIEFSHVIASLPNNSWVCWSLVVFLSRIRHWLQSSLWEILQLDCDLGFCTTDWDDRPWPQPWTILRAYSQAVQIDKAPWSLSRAEFQGLMASDYISHNAHSEIALARQQKLIVGRRAEGICLATSLSVMYSVRQYMCFRHRVA